MRWPSRCSSWPLAVREGPPRPWRGPARPGRVSWAPYVAVAAGFAVLLHSEFSNTPGSAVITVAATALAVLVSVRQLFAQRELLAARGELQTMATTDALTGLGNRRLLLGDLARQVQAPGATPGLLVLLDLNGFKNYNDAFGHPAGDALLQRLGCALADAVEPYGGRAYRPGGDEFCVIAPDASHRVALERVATQALTEVGTGFVISTALGSVVIPGDADDPTEAMRAADHALYAMKSTGRASAGRQSIDVLLRALTELHPELDGHLGSVTELVHAVGVRMGMRTDELARTDDAAALHDIGKIAISDAIINKPDALTNDEWSLVRRHTLIGEQIIAAAPALRGAAPARASVSRGVRRSRVPGRTRR